jgi:MSHA pilin protein MshD
MKRTQRGVTLIELIAVIVILSIALVSVAAGISAGLSRSADVLLETRAVALAQSYLDEILSRRFDERSSLRGIPPCRTNCTDEINFGPDLGGTCGVSSNRECRARYDDVDDYHGLDEGFEQTLPLQDAEGNEREGYGNFRVEVSVRYLQLGAAEPEDNLTTALNDLDDVRDAKHIRVTVTHLQRREGWLFDVYKANF